MQLAGYKEALATVVSTEDELEAKRQLDQAAWMVPWVCDAVEKSWESIYGLIKGSSGQIIATSAEVTLNGGLVWESPKNHQKMVVYMC